MYRVLVVDDEKIIADCVYYYLMELNDFELDIIRAYSAEEGIAVVMKSRFDLVITDIRMDNMDGLDMAERIRRVWPSCRIIVLTGHAQFQYAHRALKLQNARYLLKTEGYDRIGQEVIAALNEIEAERKRLIRSWEMESAIDRIAPVIRERYLSQLLAGCHDAFASRFDMAAILPFDINRGVALMIIRIDMQAGKQTEGKNRPQFAEVSACMQNLLSPWAETAICVKRGLLIFFLQQKETEHFQDFPLSLCDYLWELLPNWQEAIARDLGIDISICLSMRAYPQGALSDPYQRMLAVLFDPMGRNHSALLREPMERLSKRKMPLREWSVTGAQYLQTCLMTGDKQGFFAEFNAVTEPLKTLEDLSDTSALSLYSGILSILLSLLSSSEDRMSFAAGAVQMMSVDRYQSWIEAVAALEALADALFDSREQSRIHNSRVAMERVKLYIQTRYQEDLPLSRIADEFHYSPTYLSKLFKETTGVTLQQYIADVRLNSAMELLRSGNLRVQEIARAAGFESAKYFNVVFKRETGMTPTQWREMHTHLE